MRLMLLMSRYAMLSGHGYIWRNGWVDRYGVGPSVGHMLRLLN